ncbi:hypothetical protein R1flu_018222 [Riccia fluitans]|uniref:Uncharacterized protein n=1 Tax=Riccia fluitans TaxID=41844 RepID=A0ABD1ZIN1_9MARC
MNYRDLVDTGSWPSQASVASALKPMGQPTSSPYERSSVPSIRRELAQGKTSASEFYVFVTRSKAFNKPAFRVLFFYLAFCLCVLAFIKHARWSC